MIVFNKVDPAKQPLYTKATGFLQFCLIRLHTMNMHLVMGYMVRLSSTFKMLGSFRNVHTHIWLKSLLRNIFHRLIERMYF